MGTCAQRSRTVDRDRQLKAAVRVEGGGSGRLSEPAVCCSPCACDRPPFTERARVVVRALAHENFGRRQWVGVIFHLKLRAALGKGGSRCLFIAGSRSSAVTPAPLLPLCLAQTTRTEWTTRRRAGARRAADPRRSTSHDSCCGAR